MMNSILPPTLKYRLQTWTPEHWKAHYQGKPQDRISHAIEILKKLPEESHLYQLAQKAIEVLSSPGPVPAQVPLPEEKEEKATPPGTCRMILQPGITFLSGWGQKIINTVSSKKTAPAPVPSPKQREDEQMLIFACRKGDLPAIEKLLQSKVDVNCIYEEDTPLIGAILRNQIEAVRLLLKNGAKTDVKSHFWGTPLNTACYMGHPEMVQLLLDRGADVNLPGIDQNSPLLKLIKEENYEDIGILLIANGANIHTVGNDGWPALHHAYRKGQYRLADRLIEEGANPQEIIRDFDLHKLLNLEKGISLLQENFPDFEYNSSLLKVVVLEKGQGRMSPAVKKLIHEKTDLNRKDQDGNTALHLVKNLETAEALIQAGADLSIRNAAGKTAFDLVVEGMASNTAGLLYLFLKQDPRLLDTVGLDEEILTDLMRFACRDNHKELALKLLKKGAKIDVPDDSKFTALDLALVKGHFDLIEVIIKQHWGSYKTFIEHKVFAHVFGLNGFSDFGTFKVDHEGFSHSLSAKMLALYGGMFLKDKPEMQELFEAFQEAPDNLTLSPEELIKKIGAGKTVILFTGWDTHITALIFCDGYVLKCNRGAGSGKEAGVEIFQMEDTKNLPSILSDLQRFSTSPEGKSLFLTQINNRLKLKKLGTMHLKDQPVGNCGWSTAKAVFLGASYLHYLKQELPEDKALVEGMRLFKAFTPFVREKVFEYCVSSTEDLEGF